SATDLARVSLRRAAIAVMIPIVVLPGIRAMRDALRRRVAGESRAHAAGSVRCGHLVMLLRGALSERPVVELLTRVDDRLARGAADARVAGKCDQAVHRNGEVLVPRVPRDRGPGIGDEHEDAVLAVSDDADAARVLLGDLLRPGHLNAVHGEAA